MSIRLDTVNKCPEIDTPPWPRWVARYAKLSIVSSTNLKNHRSSRVLSFSFYFSLFALLPSHLYFQGFKLSNSISIKMWQFQNPAPESIQAIRLLGLACLSSVSSSSALPLSLLFVDQQQTIFSPKNEIAQFSTLSLLLCHLFLWSLLEIFETSNKVIHYILKIVYLSALVSDFGWMFSLYSILI